MPCPRRRISVLSQSLPGLRLRGRWKSSASSPRLHRCPCLSSSSKPPRRRTAASRARPRGGPVEKNVADDDANADGGGRWTHHQRSDGRRSGYSVAGDPDDWLPMARRTHGRARCSRGRHLHSSSRREVWLRRRSRAAVSCDGSQYRSTAAETLATLGRRTHRRRTVRGHYPDRFVRVSCPSPFGLYSSTCCWKIRTTTWHRSVTPSFR